MPFPPSLPDFITANQSPNISIICLRIKAIVGSAPREVGTFMLVARNALFATIGGGQMEQSAIDHAIKMLDMPNPKPSDLNFILNPKLGQCCGGRVIIEALPLDAVLTRALLKAEGEAQANAPSLYIFGAGHIGRALAQILDGLPYRVNLVDSRANQLALLSPAIKNLQKHHTPLPESLVVSAPLGSSFIMTTHDHSLDFLIAGMALARIDAPYIGMIGSAAKRQQFEKWFATQDFTRQDTDKSAIKRLICPIGAAGLGDKRPFAIALHTVSELLSAQTRALQKK